MRKIFTLLLISFISISLIGCGSSNSSSNDQSNLDPVKILMEKRWHGKAHRQGNLIPVAFDFKKITAEEAGMPRDYKKFNWAQFNVYSKQGEVLNKEEEEPTLFITPKSLDKQAPEKQRSRVKKIMGKHSPQLLIVGLRGPGFIESYFAISNVSKSTLEITELSYEGKEKWTETFTAENKN